MLIWPRLSTEKQRTVCNQNKTSKHTIIFKSLLNCVSCVLKTCSRANMSCVLTCSRANVPYVLMCSYAKVLQTFTKYLRLTLVSCKIAHYGKSLISVFQEFFANINNKIFILAGRLSTRLFFYEVLRLSLYFLIS